MTASLARHVLERAHTGHIVTSLYLDLDPERFATPPARASQIRSLLDQARRLGRGLSLDHDAARTLERDHARLEAELAPDNLSASDGPGLAVFCSGADDLYLTLPLSAAAAPAVFVEPAAHVEPVATDPAAGRWCAVLVSVDDADIVEGVGRRVIRRIRSADYVRGRSQTGDGQTHTREQDIAAHLRQVAGELRRRLEAGRFESLAIGGPVEALIGLESQLPEDLSTVLVGRLSIDPSAGSDTNVAAAVAQLIAKRRAADDEASLAELRSRMAGKQRVATGVAEVQEALVERRVEALLLRRDYDDPDNRREALVQTAILQDAEVRIYDQPEELPPPRPVAALLRF
jgi:hypothetical protein